MATQLLDAALLILSDVEDSPPMQVSLQTGTNKEKLLASYEKRGFQSWRLSNNNANIRRINERIAQLGKAETEETSEQVVGEVRLIDSVEHNRLPIFFPDKPSAEVRAWLKQQGFRWSRQRGCWQRHRSNTATYQAERIVREYSEGLL